MTMQNVACPITIVHNEKVIWLKAKKELSDMPVMMPGRARGRIKANEMTSRPKNWKRWMAKAAIDPRISDVTVANSPDSIESSKARRTSGSSEVRLNHFRVIPGIGQL